MIQDENVYDQIARFMKGTKYVLFAEAQSRYDDAGGMLEPSEIPDDGLCRVLVDTQYREQMPIPAGMTRLRKVQTREEVIAYLRNPLFELGIDISPDKWFSPRYPHIIALSAARLCGDLGRLYVFGEVRHKIAEVFEEASGIPAAVIRTGAVHSLLFFSLDTADVLPDMVLPSFAGDYGLRVFAFQKAGTPLEKSLLELEATIRRDAPASVVEWERVDRESAQRPHHSLEDVIPTILADTLNLWRTLRRRCWKRADMRTLCEDALFCVLPDGPHHNEVSFNSLQLSATDITDAMATVLNEHELEYEIIDNKADEYLMLSELQRSRQARARQLNERRAA